jgi:hypothetical protein
VRIELQTTHTHTHIYIKEITENHLKIRSAGFSLYLNFTWFTVRLQLSDLGSFDELTNK